MKNKYVCIIVACIIAVGCKPNTRDNIISNKDIVTTKNDITTDSNIIENIPLNKYSNLKIGKKYIIGKREVIKGDNNDPFDNSKHDLVINSANVIIEDTLSGYVKYCRIEDFKDRYHWSFSRSFDEFEELINDAKK